MLKENITLEKFTAYDIAAATSLSEDNWGAELPEETPALRSFIYEAMVRYYYRGGDFSVKACQNRNVEGFLLGFARDTGDVSVDWFQNRLRQFSPRERVIALAYQQYLSGNGGRVRQVSMDNDVILGLFLSRRNGCGRLMLDHIVSLAQQQGKQNIFLWADATCAYDYYLRYGFTIEQRFTNRDMPVLGDLPTFIYRLRLK